MKRYILFWALVLILASLSCSDSDNPVGPSDSLFSLTVLDADGNPDGPLRVGIINHPIGGYSLLRKSAKPCPDTEISFSLPEAGDWELAISNYYGSLVKSYSGYSEAGLLTVTWDGTDVDNDPVVSGFYRYSLTAGSFADEKWMVFEKGPDPQQTIIGALNRSGRFVTNDTLYFPGLLGDPPIDYYTDTVTITLSHPEFPAIFFYCTTELNRDGNNFSFVLDSLGLPEALVRIRVVDTGGGSVEGLRLGSINHSYIEPIQKNIFELDQEAKINFSLPTAVHVCLTVLNYYGELVDTLVNQELQAGSYTVTWHGLDSEGDPVLSGYYRYHLIAGEYEASKWIVIERGSDPEQTIIGETDADGVFITADTLFFPGLLGDPPQVVATDELGNPIGYFHYRDTVTITLSDPAVPDQFQYFVRQLIPGTNNIDLIWDPEPAR